MTYDLHYKLDQKYEFLYIMEAEINDPLKRSNAILFFASSKIALAQAKAF